MITNITKEENGTELKVEVTCAVRKFASWPIKRLTTEDLSDILKEDHKILDVVSEPNHKVGNSKRGKMKLTGTWVFSIEAENKTSKPKTTRTRSKKKETSSETTEKKTRSIRDRMSSLSKE
jgi:hypothetical protein